MKLTTPGLALKADAIESKGTVEMKSIQNGPWM